MAECRSLFERILGQIGPDPVDALVGWLAAEKEKMILQIWAKMLALGCTENELTRLCAQCPEKSREALAVNIVKEFIQQRNARASATNCELNRRRTITRSYPRFPRYRQKRVNCVDAATDGRRLGMGPRSSIHLRGVSELNGCTNKWTNDTPLDWIACTK